MHPRLDSPIGLCLLSALVSPVLFAPFASAQDAATPDAAPTNDTASAPDDLSPWAREFLPKWRVRFDVAAYYAAPSGSITPPGPASAGQTTPSREVDFEDLNFDGPRISPFGELHIARDKLRLVVSAFGYNSERTADAPFTGPLGEMQVFAGEQLSSEFDYQTFQATVSYRLLDYADGPTKHEGVFMVNAALDLVGGVRFHRVDFDSSVAPTDPQRAALAGPAPATSTSVDEVFAEPVIGARFDLQITRWLGIDVEGTVGWIDVGERSTSTTDINAGFSLDITDNFSGLIGFRILTLDLEDGEGADALDVSGSFSGIYWGVNLRF